MADNITTTEYQSARMFVSLYYDTAEKSPSDLMMFYHPDSIVMYDEDVGRGLDQIFRIMRGHPIAGQGVQLFSVDLQRSSSGGYLVVAMGTMSNSLLFTQAFVLRQKDNINTSNKIYCHNDMFKRFPSVPKATSVAYHLRSLGDYKIARAAPIGNTSSPITARETLANHNTTVQAPETQSVLSMESPQSFTEEIVQATRKHITTTGTWASVAAKAPVVAPTVQKAQAEAVITARKSKCIAQAHARGETPTRGRGVVTQTRGNQNSPQLYDASLLIRLSSFSEYWTSNLRYLRHTIYKEFSLYGHKVWNVSIRPYKDLVFVDYECKDAVNVAVRVWANASCSHGFFAGEKLCVFKKRPLRNVEHHRFEPRRVQQSQQDTPPLKPGQQIQFGFGG